MYEEQRERKKRKLANILKREYVICLLWKVLNAQNEKNCEANANDSFGNSNWLNIPGLVFHQK